MTLDSFFEKFELFAEAPNAVGKMRELILELAVQGKLVPQDCNDEPASMQLARIAKQKANLGRITRAKQGNAQIANIDEVGHSVPRGWAKVFLADLVTVVNGRAYSKDELLSAGTPVLRVGNLFTSNHWYYSDLELDAEKYCDNGDLIYAWSASFGPFIWTGPKVIYHYHIWKLQLHSEHDLDKRYLLHFLQNRTQEIKRAGHGVSMLHMTKEKMEKLAIMVPPLAEQKRIVAKVDELMALCDRLEAQQQERETRHAALAQASLTRFTDAPTPTNLDFLFHKSYAVEPAELRKTILRLAVDGQLAPQDPEDESATELMERIRSKKQILNDTKKIRQGKVSKPQTALEAPASLPMGWLWTNIDSLCFKVTDGTHFTPKYASSGVRFVSAKDIKNGTLSFLDCKFITQEEHEQLYRRCNPEYHDILISKSGSIGTVALIEEFGEFSLFESLALLKFDQECLSPHYLVHALTHLCSSLTTGHIRGVGVKHLHLDMLRGLELALPPFPEQKRIVAKVEELMGLVDRLEALLSESRERAAGLMDAVVAEIARAA